MLSLLYFLLIGLAAGWLAAKLTSTPKPKVLGMLLIGVAGAVVGGLLIRLLGFSADTVIAELITATIGAILLVFALRRWVG